MINGFVQGINYNLKGLFLGIKTPKLLLLGILRFLILIALTIVFATLAISYHDKLMALIWVKPESIWIVWIWHFLSWLLTLFMIGTSTLIAYILSQVLFSVLIMDYMSRITERIITGNVQEPKLSLFQFTFYLIKQEIPRTILPIAISLLLFVLGWLTPFGPVIATISSLITIIFLSWDNTDLVPARRLLPFKKRVHLLVKNLPFHIGFGIYFLIPLLNSIFFSFSPVGATMYYLEVVEKQQQEQEKEKQKQEGQKKSNA